MHNTTSDYMSAKSIEMRIPYCWYQQNRTEQIV